MSGPPAPNEATAEARPRSERGDRPLILALLLLLALASATTVIRNYDYWWHLAAGRFILEQASVPRADPFSFTAGGTPWIDHEWLFQVLAYAGQAAVGPGGLVCLKAALVLGLCLLLASHLKRCGHGPAGTGAILVPVLMGAAFRFDVRPEMATLVLAPLALHLAIRARDTGRLAPLAAVPAIAAVWANLHLGAVIAPAMLAAGLIPSWLLERAGRSGGPPPAGTAPPFTRRLLAATAATAAAIAVNPYGLRLYAVPFDLSRLLASLPAPNLEWAPPAPADFPIFWAALAGSVLIAAAGFRAIDPIGTPALLLAGALAALHLRNVALFCVLLPYGIGRPLRHLVEAFQRGRPYRLGTAGGRVRPGFILACALLVVAIALLPYVPPGVRPGIGISSDNEPRAAVDFLEREGVGERLFNDVLFGGYLIWRRYPEHPVFIDGRNEVYAGLLRDIFAALGDRPAWGRLMDRHRIDAALLRYPPAPEKVIYTDPAGGPPVVGERAFAAAYFPRDEWALVYWDDDAMVVLRRTAAQAGRIARLEYRHIHPDDWRQQFAGAFTGRLPLEPIVAEIRRKLEEDPGCRRARALLEVFSRLQPVTGTAGGPPSPGNG